MIDPCPHCDELIAVDDAVEKIPHFGKDGATVLTWHAECWARQIIGGLNHLMGKCSCCGGNDPPDPPEMTRREAALAAVNFYRWWREE